MGSLITRHGYAVATSVRLLRRQGGATFFTLVMLGLALALPLALALLVLEVRTGAAMPPPEAAVTVYLKPSVSEQKAQALAASVRARRDVAAVTVITATQALQELRARSSLASALDALGENPLPSALEITPAAGASMATELETLRTAFAGWPETDSVQVDRDWARRADTTQAFVQVLMRVSALLLGLAMIAVIASTVRLEIHKQRAEIELAQFLGASSAFVRRPFLYLGTLYAAAAALIACGVVALACLALADPASSLARAYGTHLALRCPSPREVGIGFGTSFVLGWVGAVIAAARQTAEFDPPP